MVWVILWTLELRRKKKTTIYLVDAFFFYLWNCLYSRLDPRHSFFWSHVSKGHCWLSVRSHPPHQALRRTFSHLILVPWVEDREDTAGPLGQKGRSWDESSGFSRSQAHALLCLQFGSGFLKTSREVQLPSEPTWGIQGMAKMLNMFHSLFPWFLKTALWCSLQDRKVPLLYKFSSLKVPFSWPPPHPYLKQSRESHIVGSSLSPIFSTVVLQSVSPWSWAFWIFPANPSVLPGLQFSRKKCCHQRLQTHFCPFLVFFFFFSFFHYEPNYFSIM